MGKQMIFHAPYEIPANPSAASRLRPKMMRQAFKELGYDVFDLTGTVAERRRRYKALKQLLAEGVKFDFLYYENSTAPNIFANSVKKGIAPFLDHCIHRLCRKNAIPVGLFYRDIYWKYRKQEQKTKPDSVKAATKQFQLSIYNRLADFWQRLDFICYQKNQVHFFLPSVQMGEIMGLAESDYSALPPGYGMQVADFEKADPTLISTVNRGKDITTEPSVTVENLITSRQDLGLRLFYVGSLLGHYRFHETWKAIQQAGVELTVCIPPTHLPDLENSYLPLGDKDIRVVFGSGPELEEHYQACQIGMLAMEPNPYREFATPVKLFEYLGHGKPVLVTEGTNAARIVSEYGAGWVVPYDETVIAQCLKQIKSNPEELAKKTEAAWQAVKWITWPSRAQEVVTTLKTKQFRN